MSKRRDAAMMRLKMARKEYLRAIRGVLKHRPKCDDGCPGWGIFVVDRFPGVEIERCDVCASKLGLTDHDLEALPEAQRALHAHPAAKGDE